MILEALIAASLGLMIYLAIPVLAMTAPVRIRERVGRFYFKLGAKSLKQFTLVRRVLSGYDIKPIAVDDEQKLLQVTLTSSTLGEDNTYRFADPDNRIKRLWNKPLGLNFEKVPAAVDAELSEWGYWARQKQNEEGMVDTATDGGDEKPRVDPYIPASSNLRLADPIDAFELVANDVDAENIKTAEKITEKRYEKYGEGIGLGQTVRAMMSYGVGVGGVMAVQYLNEQVMSGGGGSDPISAPTIMIDLVGVML